jgi:Mycotoxin biosynthesis protein UstYa
LYNFGITKIPRESAAKLVNKTVAIPDLLPDRQYAVQLDVFHQLHCLNMIRKRLYMTEADVAPDDKLMEMDHIEHCYDSLRQSLMCAVDVTPLTWKWVEKYQTSKAVLQVMHTCRDFEAVKRWAMERRVAEFNLSVHVPDDWS